MQTIPVGSDDPDVEVEREVLRTSVVALDPRTGRFEAIEHYIENPCSWGRRRGFSDRPSFNAQR
jgi:hypothetical protein